MVWGGCPEKGEITEGQGHHSALLEEVARELSQVRLGLCGSQGRSNHPWGRAQEEPRWKAYKGLRGWSEKGGSTGEKRKNKSLVSCASLVRPAKENKEPLGPLFTPLQYSYLENPMDGGAWCTAVHGVVKSWTRLSDFTFTFHLHALEKEMATYSSVLAWRIPGMGEPGGLLSMGSHRVGHD